MAFDVQPLTSDIADGILAWCGVTDPTPAQTTIAELAADFAVDTIRQYRGLDDAKAWESEKDYVLGDIVRPTHPNQHLYICTTAGESYSTEPTWTTEAESEVEDGSDGLVWTEYTRPFETKYNSLAIEMGVYLWQKRGADGAQSFSENGVQRSFEKGSFPPSMLSRITLPATTG